MTIRTMHGRVKKSKLKRSLSELIDRFVPEGQKVLCHTSESKLSARLIIIHDGVRLTINIAEDK